MIKVKKKKKKKKNEKILIITKLNKIKRKLNLIHFCLFEIPF